MKLVAVSLSLTPKEFPLEDGSNLIGRWDPDTNAYPEVDLADEDVDCLISRQHALILIDKAGVSLEDLGSTNGTFLMGGVRLKPQEVHILKDGEEFLVGKVRLRLKR